MNTSRLRSQTACLALLTSVLLTPSPASAQTKPPKPPNPSHWGVNVSFTPSWQMAPFIKKILDEDGTGQINIKGSELTIGFVRGSRNGGDWGVAFVRKPLKDGLAVSTSDVELWSITRR